MNLLLLVQLIQPLIDDKIVIDLAFLCSVLVETLDRLLCHAHSFVCFFHTLIILFILYHRNAPPVDNFMSRS